MLTVALMEMGKACYFRSTHLVRSACFTAVYCHGFTQFFQMYLQVFLLYVDFFLFFLIVQFISTTLDGRIMV